MWPHFIQSTIPFPICVTKSIYSVAETTPQMWLDNVYWKRVEDGVSEGLALRLRFGEGLSEDWWLLQTDGGESMEPRNGNK